MGNISVSIIIPAFNEEDNIAAALESVTAAVRGITADYESLVVDDGSSDRTAQAVRRVMRRDKHVRLIALDGHQGLGTAFRTGVRHAAKTYCTVFPGDNDFSGDSLRTLIISCRQADLIAGYPLSQEDRPFLRRIVSRMFTRMISLTFGTRLRYYNGPFICRTRLVQSLPLLSRGFTIYAEIKIRLAKKGIAIKEIPFRHTGRKQGSSKAFAWETIRLTLLDIWRLRTSV